MAFHVFLVEHREREVSSRVRSGDSKKFARAMTVVQEQQEGFGDVTTFKEMKRRGQNGFKYSSLVTTVIASHT